MTVNRKEFNMKKLIAITLILIMAASFAACRGAEPAVPTPVPETTDAPALTTEVPTEAPTEEPTEEPTEAPTEAPAPAVELDPAEVFEVVAHIPVGSGENEIHYIDEIDETWGPDFFRAGEDAIVVIDREYEPLWIDTATGEARRIPFDHNHSHSDRTPFEIKDGKLIAGGFVLDCATGEVTDVVPPVQTDPDYLLEERMISVFELDGEVHAVVYTVDYEYSTETMPEASEFVFNGEIGAWQPVRKLFHRIPAEKEQEDDYAAPGDLVLDNGDIDLGDVIYIAHDTEGFIYTRETESHGYESPVTFRKFSPNGDLISYVAKSFTDGDCFYDSAFFFGSDGCIYIMAEYKTEVTIYKLSM